MICPKGTVVSSGSDSESDCSALALALKTRPLCDGPPADAGVPGVLGAAGSSGINGSSGRPRPFSSVFSITELFLAQVFPCFLTTLYHLLLTSSTSNFLPLYLMKYPFFPSSVFHCALPLSLAGRSSEVLGVTLTTSSLSGKLQWICW